MLRLRLEPRHSTSLAAALSAAVLAAALALGSRAASGADSYGYVSQVRLWRSGALTEPSPLARTAAWPNAPATLAPVGYRPAHRTFANAPTYSPGLPALMWVARAIAGRCAIYVVVPLTAALLVWITYAFALRLTDPLVAAGTTVLVATSPTLLFMMMWPMSDVPVAAFWLAALLMASTARTNARAFLTAVLTGIAISIRPNLVVLAVVPVAFTLRHLSGRARSAVVQTCVALALGMFPFVAAIAVLNDILFGSPLESGYGSLWGLYSTANVRPNIARCVRWLTQSQGVYIFAFLLGIAAHVRRGASSTMLWTAVFALLVVAAYLPYYVYSEWWYLRFLLPALPVFHLLAVEGVAAVSARFGPVVRVVVTAAFVVAASAHAVAFAVNERIVGLGEGEQRYVDVGYFAAEQLPDNAVLISVQHSGSIHYYSGRATLRFDLLDPHWLDRTVEMLSVMKYHPYVVLDDWEERIFRSRFRGQQTLKLMEEAPLAALDSGMAVRVYDLLPSAGGTQPVHQIRHVPRSRCPEPE